MDSKACQHRERRRTSYPRSLRHNGRVKASSNLLSLESNKTFFRVTCVRLSDSQPHVDVPSKAEIAPAGDEEERILNFASTSPKIRCP